MVEWIQSDELQAYLEAVAFMEDRATRIRTGEAHEAIWLLEHPPLYTAGTSANEADLKDPARFPVHQSKRGGQYTYHGPGQRVAYVMLDVAARGRDVRKFVHDLEEWIIATLAEFNVTGERRDVSACGWQDRKSRLSPTERPGKTRSPHSGFDCGNGFRSTAFQSTWTPTCPISTASCPAASPATA